MLASFCRGSIEFLLLKIDIITNTDHNLINQFKRFWDLIKCILDLLCQILLDIHYHFILILPVLNEINQ